MDFCQRINNTDCNISNYVKNIIPKVVKWFQRYVNSLDELQFCGSSCTKEADSSQQIEGNSIEDNNIEMGEMVNNKMASSDAARPELEQPDTKCPRCNSDWACQQCSDCPNGAYCSRGAWTGSGECLCY